MSTQKIFSYRNADSFAENIATKYIAVKLLIACLHDKLTKPFFKFMVENPGFAEDDWQLSGDKGMS